VNGEIVKSDVMATTDRLTAGVNNAREQRKLEAGKNDRNGNESQLSSTRFVGLLFGIQNKPIIVFIAGKNKAVVGKNTVARANAMIRKPNGKSFSVSIFSFHESKSLIAVR